jgi:hypothetical protein
MIQKKIYRKNSIIGAANAHRSPSFLMFLGFRWFFSAINSMGCTTWEHVEEKSAGTGVGNDTMTQAQHAFEFAELTA